jgi:hypothetical protein
MNPKDQELIVAGLKAFAAGEETTSDQAVAIEQWPLSRNPEVDKAIWSQLSVEQLGAIASLPRPGEEEAGGCTRSGDGDGREGR